MTDRIRVVVADDHPLFRDGVVNSLNADGDFEVVGEASTGHEAVTLAVELLPDLVMLDLGMPGGDGIEATREIAVHCPATAILVLTVSEDPDNLLHAIKAGARGYVLKGVSAHGLLDAARAVTGGEVYVTPALAGGILREMTRTKPPDPFAELTARERDILDLVASGLTNRQIGEHLFLAEKTVKHYMTNVLQKLHVRSRVQAALLAAQFDMRDSEEGSAD